MNRARSRCLALLALAAATAWAPAPAGAQPAWPPPPPAPAYPGWPPPPRSRRQRRSPCSPRSRNRPPAGTGGCGGAAQPAWPVRPAPHVRRARPVQPVPRVIEEPTGPPKPETWQGSLGMRATFIRSAGFDAFSDNDVLSQISLGIQYVLARRDALAFAVGAAGDFGGRDATARSAPSSMSLSRYTAIAEGRYQFWQRGYAFLRFAPGLLHGSARVEDSSVPGVGWAGGPLQSAGGRRQRWRGAAPLRHQQSDRRMVHRGRRLRLGREPPPVARAVGRRPRSGEARAARSRDHRSARLLHALRARGRVPTYTAPAARSSTSS